MGGSNRRTWAERARDKSPPPTDAATKPIPPATVEKEPVELPEVAKATSDEKEEFSILTKEVDWPYLPLQSAQAEGTCARSITAPSTPCSIATLKHSDIIAGLKRNKMASPLSDKMASPLSDKMSSRHNELTPPPECNMHGTDAPTSNTSATQVPTKQQIAHDDDAESRLSPTAPEFTTVASGPASSGTSKSQSGSSLPTAEHQQTSNFEAVAAGLQSLALTDTSSQYEFVAPGEPYAFRRDIFGGSKEGLRGLTGGTMYGNVVTAESVDWPENSHNPVPPVEAVMLPSVLANHKAWRNYRQDGFDVMVRCNGLQWRVHREVLVKGSPFFAKHLPAQPDDKVYVNHDREMAMFADARSQPYLLYTNSLHSPRQLSCALRFMYEDYFDGGFFDPTNPLDNQIIHFNTLMYICGCSILCHGMMDFAVDNLAEIEHHAGELLKNVESVQSVRAIEEWHGSIRHSLETVRCQPAKDLVAPLHEALVELLGVSAPIIAGLRQRMLRQLDMPSPGPPLATLSTPL